MSNARTLQLYGFWRSMAAYRVRVAATIPTMQSIVGRCELLEAFAHANPKHQAGAPTWAKNADENRGTQR
jgi:hypothetical protein